MEKKKSLHIIVTFDWFVYFIVTKNLLQFNQFFPVIGLYHINKLYMNRIENMWLIIWYTFFYLFSNLSGCQHKIQLIWLLDSCILDFIGLKGVSNKFIGFQNDIHILKIKYFCLINCLSTIELAYNYHR